MTFVFHTLPHFTTIYILSKSFEYIDV